MSSKFNLEKSSSQRSQDLGHYPKAYSHAPSSKSSGSDSRSPPSRLTVPLPKPNMVLDLVEEKSSRSSLHNGDHDANGAHSESSDDSSTGEPKKNLPKLPHDPIFYDHNNFRDWSYDAQDSDDVSLHRSISVLSSSSEDTDVHVALKQNLELSLSSDVSSFSSSSSLRPVDRYSDEDCEDPKPTMRSAFAPSPDRSFVTTRSGRKSKMLVDLVKADRITARAIDLEEIQEKKRALEPFPENKPPIHFRSDVPPARRISSSSSSSSSASDTNNKSCDLASLLKAPKRFLDLTFSKGKRTYSLLDVGEPTNPSKKFKPSS